jgi:aminobenzoyl-glutamate utilization protein B
MALSDRQARGVDAVEKIRPMMSSFHREIWSYAEPAWREYRSAAAYVGLLRAEGFSVEEGSGEMPTAFCATWGDDGPVVGLYAEYDASPGYSQDTVPRRQPRAEFSRWAPGFTDAHSALGTGAAAGAIALKRTLEATGGGGRIKLFGEPAEKVCGSKAVHAAKGYYDDLDVAFAYHPLVENTVNGELQGCLYWSAVITFECTEDEPWITDNPLAGTGLGAHNSVRSPGAVDALGLMLTAVKYAKENMFPRTGLWSLNEVVLGAGNATADNLAPRIVQLQYSWRSPLAGIQEQIERVLRRCAVHVAGLANCEASLRWVTRIRPGLPNLTLAGLVHGSLTEVGVPAWDAEAYDFGRELEQALGVPPSADPFREVLYAIKSPADRDATARQALPPWQDCTGADDYTEYTWHAPTARFYTAKPLLKASGEDMNHWANNAMNGLPAALDPTWSYAAKVIAVSALRVLDDPALRSAVTGEYRRRLAAAPERFRRPLLPADFAPPVDLPWPEYVTTARGYEWVLPAMVNVGERLA